MRYLVLILLVVLLLAVLAPLAMATTEGEPIGTSLVGLAPFTAESNYMSLPGYLRWQEFQATGVEMTRLEAVQAVKAQGCDPTLGCRDAMVLNGCRQPK